MVLYFDAENVEPDLAPESQPPVNGWYHFWRTVSGALMEWR